MRVVAGVLGVAGILLILRESFETTVLPRRVTRPYRFSRGYITITWALWRFIAARLPAGKRRENFLSVFGPLSILVLFGLWVVVLVFSFALLHWGLATPINPRGPEDFGIYLYLSGVTLFTLGPGDVAATEAVGRFLTVSEAGLGLGFLAVIISYLPVLSQASSGREVAINMLDARAGSPPSVAEVLTRMAQEKNLRAAGGMLREWERWAAELLESHLSFPVLSFYRSQHDNQSWVAALTFVLDTCAVIIAAVEDADRYQAQLTFAMTRHAAVDLALISQAPPRMNPVDRLPPDRRRQLWRQLRAAGVRLRDGEAVDEKLRELRELYEPFVAALAERFLFRLPPILPDKEPVDNWQTSAWTRRAAGIGGLPVLQGETGDHFD